jgi:hypothetical protein
MVDRVASASSYKQLNKGNGGTKEAPGQASTVVQSLAANGQGDEAVRPQESRLTPDVISPGVVEDGNM